MPSTPRRLPSGSWNCYAYLGKDAEGKRIQRSVTRPTKAEARAAAVELEQSAPAQENPAASEMTLAQATEDYVRSRANVFSPSTARSYRSICRNYFGPLAEVPVTKLTRTQVQLLINQLSARLSPKTIKNIYSVITAVAGTYAPELKLTVDIKKAQRTEIVIPSREEIERLVQAADDAKNEDLALALVIGYQLGLRLGEICALTFADVQDGMVRVNKSTVKQQDNTWGVKSPKTPAGTRTIKQTAEVARRLSCRTGPPQERILSMQYGQLEDAFQRLKKKTGVSFRFHDLRHYNASLMILVGAPNFYMYRRLGHDSARMIERVYGHIMQRQMDDISDRIDAALSEKSV